MFKLESYITPLILSYVDKYVKNLKPEDSQVSLWGGDAVFSNLDLRLDVLEKELCMPFSFVNGHIHELRIHVPWTKLGSEPVIVTINTIECILKLCEECESSTDGSTSGRSGSSLKVRGEPKIIGKRTDAGTPIGIPPNYVQSLVNRVINNIAIVCNNVILKYVEDDIVLSLNVKSVEAFSVDEKWQQAFVDLSLPDLVLRKLIKLQDLTVCLDRRNASGKITTYQDPLLYRCSLDCRLYMAFENLHAKHLLATKVDILCDQLDFSVTEHQLPMFLRLIELCLALHANEIVTPDPMAKSDESSAMEGQEIDDLRLADLTKNSQQEGWGAWMWSYIPSSLAGWTEDEELSSSSHLPSSVFHLGFYIQRASFVFKIAEPLDECFNLQKKIMFVPLCSVFTEGVFIDIIIRGIDIFNCQTGITNVRALINGSCTCGADDCPEINSDLEANRFFIAGIEKEAECNEYFKGSLFDEAAVENQGQRREYCFEWDEHFVHVSNIVIQTRTPAFAMDYFYLLEIPEEFSDKSSGFSVNDLEYSNLKERAVNRIIIGPATLDLTSSVYHRLNFMLMCTKPYDYVPYSKPKEEVLDETAVMPAVDEIASMETFIPNRQLSILVVKPTIKLFIANHPHFANTAVKIGQCRRSKLFTASPVHKLPIMLIHGEIVDFRQQCAMYPCRVVKAACLHKPLSDHLLYNSHAHFNIELVRCGCFILSNISEDEVKQVLISPCDLSIYQKRLLLPNCWKNLIQPKMENFCKIRHIEQFITMPQVLLLKLFWNSWFNPTWKVQQLFDTSVIQDNFTNLRKLTLVVTATDIEWRTSDTSSVFCCAGVLGAFDVCLHYPALQSCFLTIPLLHGPEEKSSQAYLCGFFNEKHSPDESSSANIDNCICFTVQLPKDISVISVPSLCVFSCKNIAACLDPRLFEWFAYQPRFFSLLRAKNVSPPKQPSGNQHDQETHSKAGSGLSSITNTLPTESKTKSQTAITAAVEKPVANAIYVRGITDLIIDMYPVLQGLCVQMDIDGCCLILPKSAVPWSVNSIKDVAVEVRSLFLQKMFPNAIVINLPRICVTNGNQKHPSLLSIQSIPVVGIQGWCLGSDQFPWAIRMDQYSIITLIHSEVVQYCLSPGSLSATVAVNSKASPAAPSNITQLNICIHYDLQQIQLQISSVQAELTAELCRDYLGVLPNILSLINSENCYSMDGNLVSHREEGTPGASVLHSSQLDAKARKISGTSSLLGCPILQRDDMDAKGVNTAGAMQSDNCERIKVSLWLQTTLPRLSLDFVGFESNREICLKIELEDVSSSVDIQEVYSKVKFKIASLNATHYLRKNSCCEWELGPYEGITLCCGDRLTKNVYSPNPKTGVKSVYPHGSFFERDDSQPSRGPFLLVTFTRAQCKNVQKRWAKILRDCSSTELGAKLHDLCEKSSGSSKTRHVSEIDVKMLSFDCVFWTPLVLCVTQIVQPIISVVVPFFSSPTYPPKLGFYRQHSQTIVEFVNSDEDSSMPLFSALNLPLVYFNCSTIRVFFPKSLEDDKLSSFNESLFERCDKGQSDRNGIREEDLIILQVGSISVTPNADNPLSRLLLKPDIYNIAQRAGILIVPGAEVEDRQYQLDVVNLSLSTGSWNEMIQHTKSSLLPSEVTKLKTMGENPALEWNTKIESCECVTEVIFMPVVSQFNLRIVAAPAIVYEKGGYLDEEHKDVLVAGHSLEVNATTNIEFFVGFHQLALLEDQIMMNLKLLDCQELKQPCSKTSLLLQNSETVAALGNVGKDIRDSGIDSEASTLGPLLIGAVSPIPISIVQNTASTLPLNASRLKDACPATSQCTDSCAPFEILLTAGRITVSVYSTKHLLSLPDQLKLSSTRTTKCLLSKKSLSMEGIDTFKSAARKQKNLAWKEEESTSTEGSPARVINTKGKRRSSKEEDFISEMAGYEGSEESLDEGSSEENSNILNSMSYDIIPLFYLVVSQPYTFLKCHKVSQKLELSCFDINLKGTSSKMPITCSFPLLKPEIYDVCWFETLPGDADPKTGIPPALYTLAIKDFITKPGISLKLERPLKININMQKYHEIMSCWQSLKNLSSMSVLSTKCASRLVIKTTELRQGAGDFSLETIAEKCRQSLAKIDKITYQTQQLVFSLEAESSPDMALLLLSFNRTSGEMELKCNKDDLLHEASADFYFGGCLLQTQIREMARAMIGPFSFNACFTAVWEDWNICSPLPNISMKFNFDMVLINIDQEQLKCLTMIVNHFFTHAQISVCSDQTVHSGVLPLILKPNGATNRLQIWQDDLRIGVFQYTQDADDFGLMPGINEIVFCKEHNEHPGSMTWRYPQPRVLTRTEIYPVPFRAASETVAAEDSVNKKTEVRCALQYWDALHLCFITYHVFQLSETQHCILDMPPVALETYKDLVASHMWRVVMDYCDLDDTCDGAQPHRGLVSPLALAACMRVDSCFDSMFMPFLDCLVNFDFIKTTLSNHFPRNILGRKCCIPALKPYELDGTMPEFQEFLVLGLENISLRGRHWHQTCKLEADAVFRAEFLDYKFLTLQSLIEPVLIDGQICIIQDNDKPAVAESSVNVGALYLHLGQSAMHTLSLGTKAWKEEEAARNQHLMNSYIICNGTQDLLRFGQVDTDENIAIRKYQAHAYSWRTYKAKQVLHVCVEGMQWKWCEPFKINDPGVQIRVVENKTQKATLIIKVKHLNSMQTQVIISGQLVVANRLMHHLEVRLKTLKPPVLSNEDKGASSEFIANLPAMSCAPSFIIEHENPWIMQVRLIGSNNTWSGLIHLDNSAVPDGCLVTISMKESGFLLSFWCHIFIQPLENAITKLVILAPLYIVRTHLPLPLCLEITTPALYQKYTINVEGKGHEHQICCPGEPSLAHHLSFRLAPDLHLSSPSLPLSPAMISQAVKQPQFNMIAMDNLCNDWDSPLPYLWPYTCEELEKEIEQLPPCILSSLKSEHHKLSQPVNFYQPNIDLGVCLVQRWPGCQSLLIDVKPWGLLANQTGIDLILHHREDLLIPGSAVLSLPKLEGTFKLGIAYMGRIYYSNNIEQCAEDWSLNRYWPKVHGVLSRNGHVLCRIIIDTPTKLKACYLTISAREKEGIRIFTVRPHYTLVNTTKYKLLAAAFAISKSCPKIQPNSDILTTVNVESSKVPSPILYWDVLTPVSAENAELHDDDCVRYLKLCSLLHVHHPSDWSLSLQLKNLNSSDSECIYSVVVPVANNERSRPYRLTAHHYKGSVFLLIIDDEKPHLQLHNNCSFSLYYGQSVSKLSEDFVVYEESKFIDELPTLLPHGSSYYTFPIITDKFPEMYDPKLLPKLHFAEAISPENGPAVVWSSGIDVLATRDQFLNIPNCSDVKVHIEQTMTATHIYLDPVNRVEVSAKEIRSRIKPKDSPERAHYWGRSKSISSKQKSALHSEKLEPVDQRRSEISRKQGLSVGEVSTGCSEKQPSMFSNQDVVFSTIDADDRLPSNSASVVALPNVQLKSSKGSTAAMMKDRLLCYFTAHLKHMCIILLNESTEMLRVSGDDLYFVTRPLLESPSGKHNSTLVAQQQELLFCIGDLQIDNQLHVLGGHDFPVVLIGHCCPKPTASHVEPSTAWDLSRVRRESLVVMVVVVQQPMPELTWHAEDVELTLKPLAIYVEDSLLYSLSRLFENCQLSSLCNWPKDVLLKERTVPQQVWLSSNNLASPVCLQRLLIHPVSLMLSLHASLKLFISLDHTPLSFRTFEKRAFSTTWYRLGHALTMHYLSGALIRAGWVVGSLDLLGNPGGLARSVSTGMVDFFRFPYQGLMHGPWAFILGISQGASSLFRHITSGTLVSITNLASSISRNMDRLSLDKGHLERNDELRRCPPIGFTSGLAQGLTGLGINLLGAVAGIVDQPLQSVQGGTGQGLSPTATAASVISGVGKGLVGVVTKPIGGAAEFVAQAGQGILHGAGWTKILKGRYAPIFEDCSSTATNSHLKYLWKMLPECPPAACVFAVDATHINSSGNYVAAVLLLTPEALFVVSVESDMQQQAFPLIELDCRGHSSDPTLVYFVSREDDSANSLQPEDKNRDRIAEFISKSSKYMLQNYKTDETESLSDSSSQPGQAAANQQLNMATRFFVNPRLRGTFLVLYQMAQRKLLGKGYLM